jgi:hypothetical protein
MIDKKKMKNNSSTLSRSATPVRFDFNSFRNLTSPEDTANGRKVYAGQAPLQSIIDLPTNENVRTYLAEASGKLRKSYTSVHKAIRDTLLNDSESFGVLNSGIVIVARDIVIDEKVRFVTLIDPSIINGSQTQGVIKDILSYGQLPENTHLKFEIIVTNDENLIAEISIARNYQNDVMAVSIAGRRGLFDELEESLQKYYPTHKLRKSESEYPNSNDMIDTEKLLQVITALIPAQLITKKNDSEPPNKVYTYSMKARCLKEYQDIISKKNDGDIASLELYQFYLDIAPYAWELYKNWKRHQGFAGTKLWSIKREGREIVDVPDGIIFPIISSLSVFAEKKEKGWILSIPKDKFDKILIDTAKRSYIEIANHNPQTMGKNKACYSSLYQISDLYKTLSN